jgi:hypothetical protein
MVLHEDSLEIEYLRSSSTDVTVLTQVQFVPGKRSQIFQHQLC